MGGDFASQLKWYYSRLFPAALTARWLSYGDMSYFARREISMTLPGDIYLRWKSFADADALLATLKAQTPVKIDYGAVYNFPPKDKGATATHLVPLEKELVFDIDMTDYEDVMGNLKGGDAVTECDRNWRYMAIAASVMDDVLREDYGFEHVLWVYSGRRGIHCWVADKRARVLSNEVRSALADSMHVRFEGKENAGKRQYDVTAPLHPALSRAKRRECEQAFRDFVVVEQGMLDTVARIDAMLAVISNARVRMDIRSKVVEGAQTKYEPLRTWDLIQKELVRASKKDWRLRGTADFILFKHTYPRLDINVSKEINHLLKAPFCVHPKTGRVCVPFKASDALLFAPEDRSPNISQLLAEIDNPGKATEQMQNAVAIFEEFVQGVSDSSHELGKKNAVKAMDRKQALEMLRS